MRQILNFLTVAFIVLKVRGDDPFSTWSWWAVLMPLIASKTLSAISWAWEEYGAGRRLRGELELLRYDVLLRMAVKNAKREIEKSKKPVK